MAQHDDGHAFLESQSLKGGCDEPELIDGAGVTLAEAEALDGVDLSAGLIDHRLAARVLRANLIPDEGFESSDSVDD